MKPRLLWNIIALIILYLPSDTKYSILHTSQVHEIKDVVQVTYNVKHQRNNKRNLIFHISYDRVYDEQKNQNIIDIANIIVVKSVL